jgi:hypothetical protein
MAGNRRVGILGTPHAHTNAPYITDLQRETRRARKRPGRARTDKALEAARRDVLVAAAPGEGADPALVHLAVRVDGRLDLRQLSWDVGTRHC